MECSKCHHGVIRTWSTRVMCCNGLTLFGFSCYPVINNHERDGLDDSETGQGQAAALCSLAKHPLDAAESRYARSWLLVRHFAPTAMMTGCGFLFNHSPTPSSYVNIETSKTLAVHIQAACASAVATVGVPLLCLDAGWRAPSLPLAEPVPTLRPAQHDSVTASPTLD